MITSFKQFILNEIVTSSEFEKIYKLSNFELTEPFGDVIKDPAKIEREKNRLQGLMIGNWKNTLSTNNELKRSEYVNTLIIYIKTKTYNKLVEMMYGKGYKNPESDSKVIVVGIETSSAISMKYGGLPKQIKMTRGEYFKTIWAQLDKYCDMAVKFLVTGEELEDMNDDLLSLSQWAIVSIILTLLLKGKVSTTASTLGSTTGSTVIGGAEASLALKNIAKLVMKRLNVTWSKALVIGKVILNIINRILKEGIWAYGLTKGFELIYNEANTELKKSQDLDDIRLTDDESELLNKLKINPENKEKQIQKINLELQEHSEFYRVIDWSDIVNMPGWKSWKEKNKKLSGGKFTEMTDLSQDIGTVYTWYIAKYCVEFQNILFQYYTLDNMLKTIKEESNK